jgi:hypothetical protein
MFSAWMAFPPRSEELTEDWEEGGRRETLVLWESAGKAGDDA